MAASFAALFAAAILRRNPDSVVVPYDTRAYPVRVDPGDSILSVAERLAQFGGGGTNCSVPIREANAKYRNRQFAGVVLVRASGRGRFLIPLRQVSHPQAAFYSRF